jgi:class 3 adenylate cyclase
MNHPTVSSLIELYMTDSLSFYDDVAALERYLNLPAESLRNIPIYARKPAVDAIIKVKEMEKTSLFRPGLYYIVLADLCANTAFNTKYGDAEGDVRTEWFHTAAIQSIGEIEVRNYVAFSKTIGDAALLIFSSFLDVYEWSERFSANLAAMVDEYPESLKIRGVEYEDDELEERIEDFRLRARKLIHLGEVSYKEHSDPLSLAVSQTFKIEKSFSETDLGCTQAVADAIRPKLAELNLELQENQGVTIPGIGENVMTYYIRRRALKASLESLEA